jgi:hypothetical protein
MVSEMQLMKCEKSVANVRSATYVGMPQVGADCPPLTKASGAKPRSFIDSRIISQDFALKMMVLRLFAVMRVAIYKWWSTPSSFMKLLQEDYS